MGDVADLLGRTIAGRFTIEAHIGGGAMGEVFRARHVTLDSVCVVKIMRSDIAKEPMYKERFYREAKAASRLEHPNSVRVINFGQEPDGLLYIAMEHLLGHDLLSVLRKDFPLSDERIVDILLQTLAAVAGAHALGIVHRDLKPENIMIAASTDDEGARDIVKVCDFGIAKISDKRAFTTENDGKALTSSGMLIGTPEYMSPEQARGDPLDARSDLYSVGVILYQLLTGRVPFTAENALGIVLKQVTDEPDPLEKRRPGVNPRLAAICLRALRKNRDDRYQTAKEMRADLRGVFGYRAPMASDGESGALIMPRTDSSNPNLHTAPTVSAPAEPAPKRTATSDGTEISIPVTSARRTVAGVIAVVALIGAVVTGGVLASTRGTTSGEAGGASASASANANAIPTATATVNATATAIANATPTATPTAIANGNPNLRSGTVDRGARAAASANAAGATPSAAPSASGAVAAAAPAGPPYNPAAANVALGALTTERASKDAVRATMVALAPRLTECYQMALRMIGSPVPGSAEIHVSIDPSGRMQGIVNAPKHLEFARCAQGLIGAQRIAASAVESGGGTATQSLTLNP